MSTFIPSELICDILQFLQRNEVEKCQLICRYLHSIVDENSSILPLYLFSQLDICNSNEARIHRFPGRAQYTGIYIPETVSQFKCKNVIFENIFLFQDPNFPVDRYLEIFHWLTEASEKRIVTKNFLMTDNFFYEEIYEKFVTAYKIQYTVTSSNFLQNPKICLIQNPPNEISLIFSRQVDQEDFLSFVCSRKFHEAQHYTILVNFLNFEEDVFFKKFKEVFENTDNPQKLPKLIKFEGTAGKFTYYGTLKTLVLDRLKFRTELDGDLRIYELKRSDGWVLKVELFKSIGFPHIYVQFNIFHV